MAPHPNIAVNIYSPNTPGLRKPQTAEYLGELLGLSPVYLRFYGVNGLLALDSAGCDLALSNWLQSSPSMSSSRSVQGPIGKHDTCGGVPPIPPGLIYERD